jgi:hypothetical protein
MEPRDVDSAARMAITLDYGLNPELHIIFV